MASDKPKQYFQLGDKTILEHSLDSILGHDLIEGAVIAIAEADPFWPKLGYQHPKPLWLAQGGEERCDSVLNALARLAQHAQPDDWVLVHDAARPCVRRKDIDRLIETCRQHSVGGLLAVPVRDTLKRAVSDEGLPESGETVDRADLWQAQTPQMFRFEALSVTLAQALNAGVAITDEASAMEWAGHRPVLVEGHTDNIKITRPEDLDLADFILHHQD